jgi:hypothetical protein
MPPVIRCHMITCVGAGGSRVVLEANGEGELVVEYHEKRGLNVIRDTGLPPHVEAGKPVCARVVAQLPARDWAVFPEWQLMSPGTPDAT